MPGCLPEVHGSGLPHPRPAQRMSLSLRRVPKRTLPARLPARQRSWQPSPADLQTARAAVLPLVSVNYTRQYLPAWACWLYYMHYMSTDMIWQLRSTGSNDTERLGEKLGNLLSAPAVLELRSDLGGGKTTLTRGLARGLGSLNKVASPTFTLNKIYKAKNLEIHHFDFYRLTNPGLVSDQLEESLQNSRVITVVEWSDIVRGVLPDNKLTIEFKPVADNSDERLVEIKYPRSQAKLIEQLRAKLEQVEP